MGTCGCRTLASVIFMSEVIVSCNKDKTATPAAKEAEAVSPSTGSLPEALSPAAHCPSALRARTCQWRCWCTCPSIRRGLHLRVGSPLLPGGGTGAVSKSVDGRRAVPPGWGGCQGKPLPQARSRLLGEVGGSTCRAESSVCSSVVVQPTQSHPCH